MTIPQEDVCFTTHSQPRRGPADDVLLVRTLSVKEKVREFVEAQESQGLPPLDDDNNEEEEAEENNHNNNNNNNNNNNENVMSSNEEKTSRGKRPSSTQRREKKQQPQVSRKRKQRSENVDCDADDPLLLFRRSQKALRKEALHVNMKDILSRSQSSSSVWSPLVADDITSRFLLNVRQQKKQTFERLLQNEIANSQRYMSRLDGDYNNNNNNNNNGNDDGDILELVIEDEAAIMEPPSMQSSDSLLMCAAPIESTLGEASLLSNNNNSSSRGFVELDDEAEQAKSEALLRKHELWRLRQKQLRDKLHLAADSASQVMKGGGGGGGDYQQAALHVQSSSHVSTMTTTSSSSTTTATSSLSLSAARVTTADVDASAETVVLSQRSIIRRSHGQGLGLTADHIGMIRRANNFDNTSSQRVVVFETRNKKKRRTCQPPIHKASCRILK